jgi:mRNA-degrading endonuclease RelE of RelBE toxin-antitoxin system
MDFNVRLTDSAIGDLDFFPKKERRTITDGIALYLTQDANVESRRRKRLRPNRTAQWSLRLDDYRVFYDIDDPDVVKIVAVGHKERSELRIRGERVEL